jgi:hypothetical protein
MPQNSPCPASSRAEKPGIGWLGNGGVTPLSGWMKAPEGGPGWYASDGRIARASRVGSLSPDAVANAVDAATASTARIAAHRTLIIVPPPFESCGAESKTDHVRSAVTQT